MVPREKMLNITVDIKLNYHRTVHISSLKQNTDALIGPMTPETIGFAKNTKKILLVEMLHQICKKILVKSSPNSLYNTIYKSNGNGSISITVFRFRNTFYLNQKHYRLSLLYLFHVNQLGAF